MAEALKLKVDKSVFTDTLQRLGGILDQLNGQKSALQSEVNRMTGESFSGSDVKEAVDLANEALKRVDKAITKVTAQKTAIERYLNDTQNEGTGLNSAVNDIRSELPDLFK